jgi:hypothetical protein
MLNAVHEALSKLIYQQGRIDPSEVDVRFDAPSKEWVDSLTRPTVSLFLFDIQENTEKRDGAPQQLPNKDGRGERRMPPRRIDLRYMVSVLTADVEDEHELLWRVLFTLLKYREYPPETLSEPLRAVTPAVTARLAGQEEGRNMLDLWNALGSEPRPALCYIVTAPMDLGLTMDAPLVLSRRVRYIQTRDPEERPYMRTHIGGTVTDRSGRPQSGLTVRRNGTGIGAVTTAEGRFALYSLDGTAVTLTVLRDGKTLRTVDFAVPSETYDIKLDE